MPFSSHGLGAEAAALHLAAMHEPTTPSESAAPLALDWIPPVYPSEPRALIAIDREGAAVILAIHADAGEIEDFLLESLEAEPFWNELRPLMTHSPADIRAATGGWPAGTQLGARPFRDDDGRPLGVLLLDAPAEIHVLDKDQPSLSLGDSLIATYLRAWRLARDRAWLTEFSRALIAAARQGVLATDARGRVTYLNADGAELLSVSAGEAVGRDCTRVLRPASGSDHPLLAGLDGRVEEVELYVHDALGCERPLSLRMRRMVDEQGEPTGLVCLFRDPSPERTIDQEARRRDRLAVIGELAAGVAHEIRNPLTGIGNCAQLLQDRLAADPDNRRMADLILRETQRLDRIVTSLLTFARPGPPRMRSARIVDVMRAALEPDETSRAQAGIRTEFRVAGRIPEIFVDPEQIQQVLVNLVRNATQAMPDGGLLTLEITVVRRPLHLRRGLGRRAGDRVRVVRAGPQARFVRIRVRDTGCGIPDDILPRIFDPFFTTRSGGTGLGLSVSQAILHEHGGSIAVSSAAGAGTVFEVDLPVERRQGERRAED